MGSNTIEIVTQASPEACWDAIRKPIVDLDEGARRLVWTAIGGAARHYNASVQVLAHGTGARIVWIADYLPDGAAKIINGMMAQGAKAMSVALNAAAGFATVE